MKRTLNLRPGAAIRTVESDNEFRVIDRIGDGGNSVVLAAAVTRGPLQGALVAFRVFLQLDDEKRKNRFMEEAQFLLEPRHPAIMSVLEVGLARIPDKDGVREHPYQVQKLYGAPLSIALRGDVPIIYRVLWTIQLLSALRYLASLSDWVVHRDIKPANIFLDGSTAVLADFGMMKRKSEFSDVREDSEVLRTKMPKHYRTPDLVEYLRNGATPTPRSDVFQLGLVVAEMFFKWNPLKEAGAIDADVELCTLHAGSGGYEGRILDLVQRMLVLQPQDREMAESLLDDWDGVLHSVADNYTSLEGRVLPRRW